MVQRGLCSSIVMAKTVALEGRQDLSPLNIEKMHTWHVWSGLIQWQAVADSSRRISSIEYGGRIHAKMYQFALVLSKIFINCNHIFMFWIYARQDKELIYI